MNNKNNIELLERYLKTINKTYCSFLLYYNLYHELLLNSSTGEHQGKDDAEKKTEVMNKYLYFFSGVRGLYKLAIIELHKLFDKSKPGNAESTISLHFLINYIETNYDEANIKNKSDFIKSCRKKIDKISNKLTYLKNSRDNLSHNLPKLKAEQLKFTDIDDIVKIIDELFNYISITLQKKEWGFENFYEEPKRDLNLLIEDLMKLDEIGFTIINNSGKMNDSDLLKEIKTILEFDYL